MLVYKIILFIGILSGIVGQMSLKHGMNRQGEVHLAFNKGLPRQIFNMFLNWYVLLGVFVYGASALLWVAVLSKLDLSYAYPLVSINFVLVALSSRIFFKEHVSKFRWLTIFLIFSGVVLVSLS